MKSRRKWQSGAHSRFEHRSKIKLEKLRYTSIIRLNGRFFERFSRLFFRYAIPRSNKCPL